MQARAERGTRREPRGGKPRPAAAARRGEKPFSLMRLAFRLPAAFLEHGCEVAEDKPAPSVADWAELRGSLRVLRSLSAHKRRRRDTTAEGGRKPSASVGTT